MALWEELTMEEFRRAREENLPVILPVGSVEEHGPHLPLGTDAYHALEVARRAARLKPVLIAPPLFYGICRSTREHPGTLSLSGNTLRALILDLGREFYRQGLRRLLIITGHAGGTHFCALQEAGETLLGELPEIKIAVVNILDLLREVLTSNPELLATPGDAHAGEVETSVMQAAYPHLVKGSAPAERPSFPKYLLVRDKTSFWPGGVWGDPGAASPEKGEKILELEARRLAEIIGALENFT